MERMSEMDVRVGDVLRMKKPHPCGSLEFTVLRVGMDFSALATRIRPFTDSVASRAKAKPVCAPAGRG